MSNLTQQSVCFTNAAALTPCGMIEPAQVHVANGLITYVGSMQDAPSFDAQRTIDATGHVVMPGFVNAHTHAAMTLFRGFAGDLSLLDWLHQIWPVEDTLTGNDVYWLTNLAIAEMLKTGTTAFLDMYDFMEDVAKAVLETGIRATLSQGSTGFGDKAAKLEKARRLHSGFHGADNNRIRMMVAPHAEYTCPPEFLIQLRDLAQQLDVGIHIHIAESPAEMKDSFERNGVSPVVHLDRLGLLTGRTTAAHCVHLSDEDMDILAARGVNVAHNPGSNLKLGSGISPVPQLLARGVNVALGTDGAGSNNNLDMWQEMGLAALIHKGAQENPLVVPVQAALHMATRAGALAIDAPETGVLEAGKKADLIMVDTTGIHYRPRRELAQHLIYSGGANDVKLTMVDGRILYENGQFLTLDVARAIDEVENIAKRLLP